ncbi:hypothetical protein HPB50_011970 [Hyalomma asiaticum]|uniref:Uncharacterized protein n=1 Tax=Hyalomma asiaticum TaxID=266040 RepID=A0ACB7T9J3_HYAAI|nr:hypothetical protein HPB50_011970 [Hyalomma asiaticum]
MEVRKQAQEITATFAREITQQLQQHITVQLAPTYATFQELSSFVFYASQNHVTKATVVKMLNSTEAARKKARKDLHNRSRPESMTLGEITKLHRMACSTYIHWYPEKTPQRQAGRKPGPSQGQGPDPTPLTQKSESLPQMVQQEMRECKSPQKLRVIC